MLRVHIDGTRAVSVTPVYNSFGVFNKLCQKIRLLMARSIYVRPTCCTSSNMFFARSSMSRGGTRLGVRTLLSTERAAIANYRIRFRLCSGRGLLYHITDTRINRSGGIIVSVILREPRL